MKYKILFIVAIATIFIGCVKEQSLNVDYNSKDNLLVVNVENKNINIPLTDYKHEMQFTTCVDPNSFTLFDKNSKYGTFFVESISLNSDCKWNGLASGYFISEFKSNMKIKSLKLLDRVSKKSVEISTYLADGKYLNFIYIYGPSDDRMILDTKGELSQLILNQLGLDDKINYLDKPRFELNSYDFSLVENNFLKKYFSRESMEWKTN